MVQPEGDALAIELIEIAQLGRESDVLDRISVEEALGDLPAALSFARCVALDSNARHAEAVVSATEGVHAATRTGRDGWLAACLAMRALQRVKDGRDDAAGFDESPALHDLAQAQVVLARGDSDPSGVGAAANVLGVAYFELRLYELARPIFLSAMPPQGLAGKETSASAIIVHLNLAELELTWALELYRVDEPDAAREHCRTALAHAQAGSARADGAFRDTWVQRADVLGGCALALLSDDLTAAAASIATAREQMLALSHIGIDHERAFTAPLLGLALARTGQYDEGLAIVGAAVARLHEFSDPLLVAGTRHAQLVLLAPVSSGAAAGLALSQALSQVLWRQRSRRLAAAEAIVRLERLRAEHETVSRETDVDTLTGTATRRALDRRFAELEARCAAGGLGAGVAVVDLDGLKRVNDELGHRTGDLVLRGVGAALLSAVRGHDLVGRYGGDEFVVLVDGGADVRQRLDDVARRALHAVRSLRWPDDLPGRPSVSIGLAHADAHHSLEQALVQADLAMYVAKRSGGDAASVAASPSRSPIPAPMPPPALEPVIG